MMSKVTFREMRVFRRTYKRMSLNGECDSIDGMEYQRVLREWVAAGRPHPVTEFIFVAANVDHTGKGREQTN